MKPLPVARTVPAIPSPRVSSSVTNPSGTRNGIHVANRSRSGRWRGGPVRSGDHVSTWGFGRPGWLLYAPRGPAGKTSWAGTRPRESLAMGKAVNYATRLVEPAFNAVEVVEIVGVVSPEDCVSD